MTQLTKDTPVPVVWLWMFIAGLGVGPTFSVFTIVIQNAVPFRQLGVATSNLTFFRQIGGTIALAFVGTIFGTTFTGASCRRSCRPPASRRTSSQGFDAAAASGQRSTCERPDRRRRPGPSDPRQSVPVQAQSGRSTQIVEGIHGAFSLATAQTFWLGVAGSVVARPRGGRDQGDPAPGDQQRSRPGQGRQRWCRHRLRRPTDPVPPLVCDAPVVPIGASWRPGRYDRSR